MLPVQVTKYRLGGGEVAVIVPVTQQHRRVLEEPLGPRSPRLHFDGTATGPQPLGRDPGWGTGGPPDLGAVQLHRWIARPAARQGAQREPQVERALGDDQATE